VREAKAEKRPDWSFGVSYGRRDPMFGDMVSATASVSLPLFGATRQDPVIEARLADANRVRFDREDARRALLAALEADLADHAMHHDQLMHSRDILVPLAKQRSDLETASYGADRASLSDVLSAFTGLAQAELEESDREATAERDAARIVLTYGSGDQ
jgi:outer membrane protein TolC